MSRRLLLPLVVLPLVFGDQLRAGVFVVRGTALDERGFPPVDVGTATTALVDLLAAWREGMDEPLPFASKTAWAFVKGRKAGEVYDGGKQTVHPEGREFSLHRVYPDFDALAAHGRFAHYATRLFAPIDGWLSTVTVERLDVVVPAADQEAPA